MATVSVTLKLRARDHALLEVGAALTVGLKREGGEFVDRAAGLVAELVDDLVFRLLGQQGDRGGAGLLSAAQVAESLFSDRVNLGGREEVT